MGKGMEPNPWAASVGTAEMYLSLSYAANTDQPARCDNVHLIELPSLSLFPTPFLSSPF